MPSLFWRIRCLPVARRAERIVAGIDLEAVNAALDTAVLVAEADGRFRVHGTPPDWLCEFDPRIRDDEPFNLRETLVFFATFLDEVRDVLRADNRARVSSGPWSEADGAGKERNLSAVGLMVNGHLVIQLRLIDSGQLYHQAVFQKAREYSLAYERLLKERDRKQVLLHAIVRDLTGPLTAISGALDLVDEESLDWTQGAARDEMPGLLKLARAQCETEKDMIQSILETFLTEASTFDARLLTAETAPDLQACVHETVDAFAPAYASQGLRLTVADEQSGPILVFAEPDRLRRVLSNLLENALRYCPPATETRVAVTRRSGYARVSVTDAGDGKVDEIWARLVQDFSEDRGHDGKTGFGLFFCRISVERWGGTISCEAAPIDASTGDSPGTCIWFQLRTLD